MSKKNTLAERLNLAKKELASALDDDLAAQEPTTDRKKIDAARTQTKAKNNFPGVTPKLYVSGRFDRKSYSYQAKSFYINEKLDEEIKAYCRGTDITVYNYLIYLGLNSVKELSEGINAGAPDIEKKYSNEAC